MEVRGIEESGGDGGIDHSSVQLTDSTNERVAAAPADEPTRWLAFAREELEGGLDAPVADEVGQLALANGLAVAGAPDRRPRWPARTPGSFEGTPSGGRDGSNEFNRAV